MKYQAIVSMIFLTSCVSLAEYKSKKMELAELEKGNKDLRKEIKSLEKEKKVLTDTIRNRNERNQLLSNAIKRRLEAHKIKTKIQSRDLAGLTISYPVTNPESYAELMQKHKNRDTNSAKNMAWLSEKEKKVYYWLNVARLNPREFCNTYIIPKWKRDTNDIYLLTLIDYMYAMKPMNALKPDKTLFENAKCHAVSSGKTGYVGHQRQNSECKSGFWAECCSYGIEDPLGIVLQLLVDQGVPSLGHRYICLGWYENCGISQAPHKGFTVNTVLDFN